MLHDSVPILHEFPDRRDIKLTGVFDVHFGARGFLESKWAEFKRRVLADPNHFLVFGGDLINNGTKSSVTNVYEETMRPREQKEWLAREISDLKAHVLCGFPGNHENRSAKEVDLNPLYDCFVRAGLETVYRENAAFMVLRFGQKAAKGIENPTYMIAAAHGAGGGSQTGGSVNRYTAYGRMLEGFDMGIFGHVHKPFFVPDSRICIDPRNMRVKERPFLVVSAAPWLAYDGYPVRKMLLPSAMVTQEVTLCGDHKEIKASMSMKF